MKRKVNVNLDNIEKFHYYAGDIKFYVCVSNTFKNGTVEVDYKEDASLNKLTHLEKLSIVQKLIANQIKNAKAKNDY